MRRNRLINFTLLLCWSAWSVNAQDFILDKKFYGIKEGLSHRDVQCIAQDTQGFIWLGTKYGLNRFDGYRFKWYTKENSGLQSNEINHILQDKKGKFWLISTGAFFKKTVISIDIFDPVTEEIKSFENHFGKNAPFKAGEISCFNQVEKNEIIFFTSDGHLATFDGTFHIVENKWGKKGRIENIYRSPTGFFWLVNFVPSKDPAREECTIQVINDEGRMVKSYYDPEFDFALIYDFDPNGACHFIQSKVHKANRFFMITSGWIRRPDTLAQNAFSKEKFDSHPFTPLAKIRKHQSFYWVIDGENLLPENPISGIVDFDEGKENPWKEKFKDIEMPTDMLFDRSGKLWISTQFGLYLLQLKPNHFKKYFHDFEGRKPPVRGMAEDDSGTLWIVEENTHNLLKLNLKTGAESSANISETNQNHLPFFELFYTIAKSKTNHLYYQSKNELIKFDPITYQTTRQKIWENEKSIGPIWAIYEDDFDKIWIAPFEHPIRYLNDSKITDLPPLDSEFPNTPIYQFFKSDDGTIWLATDIGLFTLDVKAGKILERYWSGGKGKNYLPFDKIFHICEDQDGSFWLGTGGAGLLHWNKGKPLDNHHIVSTYSQQPENFRQFTVWHGLSNNTIYAVYTDDFDNLWLSSDYGIMRFNKKTHQTQAYLEEDGISHNECNRIAHYKTKDGSIFFGGLNGLTAFDPKDFSKDTSVRHPSLVITQFQQFDGTLEKLVDQTTSIRKSATITMSPDDWFFLLEFALLTFENIDKVQYAYMVEGMDKNWTYQKENTLRISRLHYGQYVLRIKGQTANGPWSKNELRLNVIVLKPFYIQTWFLTTLGLLLFAGGLSFYKWRVRSLKNRQVELEKIVRERTRKIETDKMVIEQQSEELKSLEQLKSRFFANVSHELRTPLTLMLGPVNSLLKRKEKDTEEKKLLQFIQRNVQQLQKLINEILDLSKLEDNKLELVEEPVNIFPYLKDQVAQFHSAAMSNEVNLQLEFQADKGLKILLDKSKFEKIVHNFLSNALKFTVKGDAILLQVEEFAGHLKLSVSDTGRGIHPDDLPYVFDRFYQSKQPDAPTEGGTGIGLSLVKELAELLGGEVGVKSEMGKGSSFFFKFPKKESVGLSPQNPEIELPKTVEEKKESFSKITTAAISNPGAATGNPASTILLVEDNEDLRNYLQFLLSDYQVLTAENGQEALEKLSSQNQDSTFDLIISDLMMPVMDGFQFLEMVKADDRWRHLPVIMLTAKVNFRSKLQALRIGVDDYLTKPFQEEELKARIENLLHNYHTRMEHFSANAAMEPISEETAVPIKPVIAQVDYEWLKEVESVFSRILSDRNFNLEWVASELSLSSRQFNRRLQKLIGLSPNHYLQEMRLQMAKDQLLCGKYATVKETGYAVGFRDTRYFSSLFQERFGVTPSAYLR